MGSVLRTPVVCTYHSQSAILVGKKSPGYFTFTARVYLHCGRRFPEAPAAELVGGALEGAGGMLEAEGCSALAVAPGRGSPEVLVAGAQPRFISSDLRSDHLVDLVLVNVSGIRIKPG